MVHAAAEELVLSPSCAPSVLISFINMMLRNSPVAARGCEPWMYAAQPRVERALLALAFACVPAMLLAKPALFIWRRRRVRINESDMLRPFFDRLSMLI